MRRRILAIPPAFLLLAITLSACAAASSGAADGVKSPTATPDHAASAGPADAPTSAKTAEPSASPEWFGVELTDVNTGQSYTINSLRGKVVLVETMAMWCPYCLSQQQAVKALHSRIGNEEQWVGIALDIDPNENAEALKTYASNNGFDWFYTIAPPEVYREIGRLYGDQFLNPPSTPMLIVDREGNVHPLPFGIKSVEDLQGFLQPFLNG
jgi:thiol-disulfide isomerase/thioredoxin